VITLDKLRRTPVSTVELIENYRQMGKLALVGIDGKLLDISEEFSRPKMELLKFIIGGEPSSGEIGCLLSHQAIYKDIVKDGIDSALILEDDAEMLVDIKDLSGAITICEKSKYDLVSFYAPKGGIVVDCDNKIQRALVPGLYAVAYWISQKGATKLYTGDYLLGLADWPVAVANLRTGVFREQLFTHSGEKNSIIFPTLNSNAQNRKNISINSMSKVLALEAFPKLYLLSKIVGLSTLLKYIFGHRIIRRIFKLLTRTPRGSNYTIVFKSSKLK